MYMWWKWKMLIVMMRWVRRIFLFVGVVIEGESEHPYMGMPSTFSPHWLQACCSCLSTKWPSSIAFRGPTNYFCFGEIVSKLWLNNRDDHFFLDTVFTKTLLCSKQTYTVDKARWILGFLLHFWVSLQMLTVYLQTLIDLSLHFCLFLKAQRKIWMTVGLNRQYSHFWL